MRQPTIAALALGLALGACSGGEDQPGEDAGPGGDGIAARAASVPQLQPGRYEVKATLLEFAMPDIPGAPAGQFDNMQSMMASEMEKPQTYCLTAEEAAEGPKRMMNHLAESDCTFSRFDVTANTMSGEMQCSDKSGMNGTVKIDGTFAGDSSSTTMEWSQRMPGIAGDGVHMRVRSDSRRIGECTG